MSDAKGLFMALVVVLLLGFVAASCVKRQNLEECKQRGGQVVRTQGSDYECKDPEVK